MKALWITEFFPASSQAEITGGVEARCYYVSRHLEKLGHKVAVIARKTGGQTWTNASFSSLPQRIRFVAVSLIRGLQSDFDVIEGTNFTTYPVAWTVGTLKHKPVIFWYADVFLGNWVKTVGPVGLLGEIAERVILKLPVNRYVAISESTRDKLIRAGIPKGKIDVVYCGAEPAEIAQAKSSPVKKYDICVVSRLVGYKKVDEVIRAVDRKTSVAIIGQGPEIEKLKALSSGKKITFLGHVKSHLEVLKVISSAKIFCLPSSTEGFGITVIEAASLRVPYIARDIPVIREITADGQGGLLFSQNDLPVKLKELLTDRALYRRKCREAVRIARKYTWEKAARRTLLIYESLLSH